MEPDIIRKFFLRANPNPGREGCPDRRDLKGIADNTLPFDHPARLHLASCSPCFSEFLQFKKARKAVRSGSLRRSVVALAACLTLVAGGALFLYRLRSSRAELALKPVSKTVDLFNVGTLRGLEPTKLSTTPILPITSIHLRMILPRFSDPGRYRVGITREKSDKNIVAEATGETVAEGSQQIVHVELDLRSVSPGVYLLLTTHEKDEASYYYPIRVGAD